MVASPAEPPTVTLAVPAEVHMRGVMVTDAPGVPTMIVSHVTRPTNPAPAIFCAPIAFCEPNTTPVAAVASTQQEYRASIFPLLG